MTSHSDSVQSNPTSKQTPKRQQPFGHPLTLDFSVTIGVTAAACIAALTTSDTT